MRSFALDHAQAEQVKTLLNEMFEQAKKALSRPADLSSSGTEKGVFPPIPPNLAGKGLPYNVTVSSDVRSNTVFVVGRRDAVLLAAGLIEQMDKPGGELGMKPYFVNLKNMPATTLAEKLTELLDKRIETLGGGENAARDNAVIIPDDRSNALIVFAMEETCMKWLPELARQIDDAASYRVVGTQTHRLKFADSAKLQGLLQELFDKKKEAGGATETEVKDALFVLADARHELAHADRYARLSRRGRAAHQRPRQGV